jgi:hypothetical protein
MGKLIEITSFGKKPNKKIETSLNRKSEDVKSIRQISESRKLPTIPEIMKAKEILSLAKRIELYIDTLRLTSPVSNEVLAVAERFWKSNNMDELINNAKNSTEQDWSKSPGRYLELARTLRKKVVEIMGEIN